ncbi:MAG: hypothetical protein CVT59_02115, partial [Actinobacteria bacterium HGW-Actinobacteria-1]
MAIAIAMCASFVGTPIVAMAAPGTPTYEVEPNDNSAQANVLAVDGTIMNGTYSSGADDDWYAVNLLAGHTYGFQMGPNTDQPTIMSDVWLELWDPTVSSQLGANDDWYGLFSFIEYTPSSDGTYYLKTNYLSHYTSGPYGIRAYDTADFSVGEATISGTVTDANDDPVEGAEVIDWGVDPWYSEFPSLTTEIGSTTTAADGTYTITAAAGDNFLGFFADGYYDLYYNQQPYFDSADAVAAVADDAITGIDAQLEELPPLDTFVTETVRVSTDADGEQGMDDYESNRGSRSAAISADGQFVAFYTGNVLVEEDTNDYRDWYLKDLATGDVTLVSVADDESPANDDYSEGDGRASVSGDGRYVAFDSYASNLIGEEADNNGSEDIFVRDVVDGTTVRVSIASDGTEADYGSWDPSISDDGRYVSFTSDATNLVEGDDNGYNDVFVHDLQTGTTTRVSVDAEGGQANESCGTSEISGDGSTIAFLSAASLVEDDSNGYTDVYVKTLADGSIARASVASDGTEANDSSSDYDFPALSEDGQLVVFISSASNLVDDDANDERDVFMHDFGTGETVLVSLNSAGEQTYDYPEDPSMSADGRFVTFEDEAGEMKPVSVSDLSLVNGDVNNEDDIVLKDMQTGTVSMVTVSSEGNPADDASYGPVISGDGMVIAYTSDATNLVADDTNDCSDVFAGYISLEPSDVTETPLEGEDRYGTSIEVSMDTFPEGADA